MTTQVATITPNRFAYGYFRQVWWSWLIGSAFFFGEIGAGLFLVSLLTGFWPGMAAGYLIVMVGKNGAHLLYLGRPERFWRAAMRPDRSWIARGLWATGIFALAGLALLVDLAAGDAWQLAGAAKSAAYALAGLSAFFIMFYDGFVMCFSRAIPFWSTRLLPILCLTYATLGGVTLAITLRGLTGYYDAFEGLLLRVEYGLLIANAALLAVYLFRQSHGSSAAAETVRLLLKGAYAGAFLGLVVLLGLVGTLLLSLVHAWTQSAWVVPAIALAELTGDFALLMVFLKSGLFQPQTAPA